MSQVEHAADATTEGRVADARRRLDEWTREVVQWHFDPETGCPFWLEYAERLDWDPREEIRSFQDLERFGPFQDEWLRGGPVRRWVPKGYADRPVTPSRPAAARAFPRAGSASTIFASTTPNSATP